MNEPDDPRRVLYLLSIWHEERDVMQVWHGYIETAAEQRLYFHSLAGLNYLLCELGGWMDPPLSLQQGPQVPGSGKTDGG